MWSGRALVCFPSLLWLCSCVPAIPGTEFQGLSDTATEAPDAEGTEPTTTTWVETIPGTDPGSTTSTTTTETETETEVPEGWCLDWEDGSLRDAGYVGELMELEDGALLVVVREGDDFSALVGEEELEFRDLRALMMRSSGAGEITSVAVAISPQFEVNAPLLWWWQLSEVGAGGVAIDAELIDADGAVVAALEVPIETGGFVPALQDVHDPIEARPEIDYGAHTPGELTLQVIDMSPFMGLELSLKLYQHTLIAENGFFTVIDDICHGLGPKDDTDGVVLEWN